MPKININTNRSEFNIPDNSIGLKRKAILRKFTFDLMNEKFKLEFDIYHYENDNGNYGNKIELVSVTNFIENFIGDKLIMVSLEMNNLGEILNPDREDVPLTYGVPTPATKQELYYVPQRDQNNEVIRDNNGKLILIPQYRTVNYTEYIVNFNYTSQYEFLYDIYLNQNVNIYDMIENLVNSYTNWPDL